MTRLLVVCALAFASNASAQYTDGNREAAVGSDVQGDERSRVSQSLEITISSTYHANPFNLRKHWTEPAAGRNASAGERLQGYKAPWDVVTAAAVDLGQQWRRPSGVRSEVHGAVTYEHYALNPAHSRAVLAGSASYRTKNRIVTSVDIDWTPRTLQGNRRVADEAVFEAAYYSGFSVGVAQRRRLAPGWTIRPAVDYAERRFENPFADRGRRTGQIGAQLRYDANGAAAISTTAGAGRARPIVPSGSMEGNRGFSFYEGAATVQWRQQADWVIRGRARVRSISFDLPAGDESAARSRRDLAGRLDVKATRHLTAATSLWLQVGGRNRTSERSFDNVISEDIISSGYFVRLGTDLTF